MQPELRNNSVRLVLRENGSIQELRNERTGLCIRPGRGAGWPFTAAIRDRETGELLRAVIDEDYAGTVRIETAATRMVIAWTDLQAADGRATQVDLTLQISCVEGAFRLAPALQVRSDRYEVDELCFFSGTELTFGAPADERVCVPYWSEGLILHDPRHVVYRRHPAYHKAFQPEFEPFWHHSYTPWHVEGLSHGWMAAYGPEGGLGIGYLNHSLATMEFRLGRSEAGLEISPTFFRLRNYGEEYPFFESKPLALGALLLMPLTGDWHEAADTYRTHYRREMGPDLPPLGQGSRRAARLDVNIHFPIYGAHGATNEPILHMTFAEVTEKVRAFITEHEVDPSRVLVWLYGQGEAGHDRGNPTQRPINRQAGGKTGWRTMIAELKAMGVGSVMAYAHAFATQQNQPRYDAGMDVGKGWKMMNAVYHTCLCLDHQPTQDFFSEQVFKPFLEDGITDMFLDQPTICKGICERPDHDHDATWVGKLGAHARGTRRQMERLHEVFGPETVINVESYNDLGCRDVEMATNTMIFRPERVVNGVEMNPDVNAYTAPHVVRMNNHLPAQSVAPSMIRGFSCMVSHFGEKDKELVARYLRFRETLLRDGPGFPFGFRDTVGLSVPAREVEAKVFVAPGKGLTVTWLAFAPVHTTIAVDLAAHGFSGAWQIPVAAAAEGETGYAIWTMNQRPGASC